MSWVRAAAIGALVAVAIGLSGLTWRVIFADSLTIVGLVAAASVVGAAIAVAGSRWLRPGLALVAAGGMVAGMLLIGEPRELATTGLLIGSQAKFIAIPLGASLAGALLTTNMMIRRSVAPLGLAVIGVVHSLASAYSVAVESAGFWPLLAAVVAAIGALGLSTTSNADGETAPSTLGAIGALPGLAVGAAAVVAGAGLLWLGSDDGSFDLRQRIDPPIEILDASSPLSLVKSGLIDEQASEVFTIAVSGLGPDQQIERIPAAILDNYDGAVWSSSGQFIPAGAQLPAPAQGQVADQTALTQRVELSAEYPFLTVPSIGSAVSIEQGELLWDPVSGALVSLDAGTDSVSYSGSVTPTYQFRPEEGPAELNGGPAGALTASPDELRSIETVRTTFADFVAPARAQHPDDQWAQLLALEAALRDQQFGYNSEAPGGHSLAKLATYLAGDAGGRSAGFDEQSAAAFAVLARVIDVPSRVVVGYVPAEPLTAAQPQASLDSTQVSAWPEVWLDGVGWVAFDPTDEQNLTDDVAAKPPVSSDEGDDTAAAATPPEIDPPEALIEELPEDEGGGVSLRWLALLLLPLLYLAVVVGAKRVRRGGRRSADDPAERIIGAWRETEDRLVDAGQPVPVSGRVIDLRDTLDLTEDAGSDVLTRSLTDLADDVDLALYSPDVPSTEVADGAWDAAAVSLGEMSRDWSSLTKLKAAANPRSFFRR